MVETPHRHPPSNDFSRQEQHMFNYKGWLVNPNTPARGQLFIDSVTSYAYDAADVLENDSFATVLEDFVSKLSLQEAQVNSKKVVEGR